MASARILVVDDEPGMTRLVSLYLRQAGHDVEAVGTGADAFHAVETEAIDLVVLDVGLPDIDGYSVCKHMRSVSDVPIIMLTARAEQRDRLLGFELGADDYVPKPFNPEELVARIHAVLRRAQPERHEPRQLVLDGLIVDRIERTVTADGRPVELSPKEFDLLAQLASQPDRVFTRNQLLKQVWGYEAMGETATVDVHVSRLRRKLGTAARKRQWIRTVWGTGYRFNAKPHGS
jgi:DNA-binding response OmpR family regulator